MSITFSNIKMKTDGKIIYLLFGILMTYFSSYLPDIANVIGLEGMRISSLVAFASLNGMLFGPLWGSVVSVTGMFLHELDNPGYISKDSFSILSPFFLILCSVVSGYVVNRKHRIAAGILCALLIIWYLFDTGRSAYLYPWFHIVILVSFIFVNKFSLSFMTTKAYVFISLFYAAIMGILSDHLAGSIAYNYVYGLSASQFNSVIFIYPLERMLLALSTTFVAFFFFSVFKEIILSSDTVKIELDEREKQEMSDHIKEAQEIINGNISLK